MARRTSSTPIKAASSPVWSLLGSARRMHGHQYGWPWLLARHVFVERLWKSVKYEEVYLHANETVSAAQQGLERYRTFYNQTRPHWALDGHTPDRVYFDNRPTRLTAA